MKIGILTLPLHINYGGYLQAFALKSILLEHGNEVYLIENKNLYGNLLKRGLRQIKDSFSLLLFYLGKKNKEAEFILKEKKISIFKDNYMCPIVDISNSKTLNDLDIVIVGSDQVWRPWKGLCRNSLYFFLDFIKSTKTKNISWSKKFELDVYYVRHISLWMDIRVFFTTIKKVLFRDDINQEGGEWVTMDPFNGNN